MYTITMRAGGEQPGWTRADPQMYPGYGASVQGYAVKAGMLVGRGELLLFMDADGATRVSDVEKLEAGLSDLAASRAPAFLPLP